MKNTNTNTNANTTKQKDLTYWQAYSAKGTAKNRDALLKRMHPLIMKQVNVWSGPVPASVLKNEAKVLTIKAFDTYDPKKGTALSTHVVNNLAPLSRVVYTHQNAARLPENITLKVRAYQQAQEYLTSIHGRAPTTDELHQELGWTTAEINRVSKSEIKDLVESVGGVNATFFSGKEQSEEDLLAAVYYDLTPTEKKLFEATTGYNNKPILKNSEIVKKFHMTQTQVSYNKTLLTNKINRIMASRK